MGVEGLGLKKKLTQKRSQAEDLQSFHPATQQKNFLFR